MSQKKVLVEEEQPKAAAAKPSVDVVAEIASYVWQQRWFIVKFMSIAVVGFAVLLICIPAKFKAQATIVITPPRFVSEVRAEPFSVETAKNLLSTGELAEQMIRAITDARKAVEHYAASHGTTLEAFDSLAAMPTDAKHRLLRVGDEKLASYMDTLSARELKSLLDIKPSELEDWTADDLAKALESEDVIEKKTAADIKISPLLKLYAVADSGPKAQLLANTWATLFEKKYDELTTQKTKTQYDSIAKQQRESQTELADIMTTLVQFKAQNNLELYQRYIDEYSDNMREFSNQLQLKQHTLNTDRQKLIELMKMQRAVEYDGRWAGRVGRVQMEDPYGLDPSDTTSTSDSMLLADEGSPEASESSAGLYQDLRQKVLRSRDMLRESMNDSYYFYQEHPIDLMQSQRDQIQKDYIEAYSKLRAGEVRLQVFKNTLAELDARLSGTQQLISLNTGVPLVNVGEALVSGRKQDVESLSRTRFEREELNPVWSDLQTQKTKLQSDYEMVLNEVQEMQKDLPEKDKQLKELQNEIYRAQMNEQLVKDRVSKWQKANNELYTSYIETNNQIYSTAKDLTLLEQEIRELEKSTSQTKTMVEDYQQRYNSAAAELQRLEAHQRAIQRNSDLLLQKLQEAQIAVREEVSDVSIAARAITPMKHYFPPRALLLAALTFFTAALLVAGLARKRYLELGIHQDSRV